MFIYSLKASTIRFFGIVCVALAALIALVAFFPPYVSGNGNADAPAAHLPEETSAPGGQTPNGAESVTYRYDKVRSADDAAAFLGQFGWVVDAGSAETAQVTIPAEFDKVMNSYNEIQKNQGLDLSKYKGKEVVRYTYEITNYPDYGGTVYANVIIHKNRVVGGDVCSADVTGFISGFAMPEGKSSGK